ncbi:MAG: hypothetical protein H0W59_02665 [Chloroflexia bacterium]|jgi:hypothetical protein|nr:hypothetical protein [Chloroflexia bacterium]
MMAISPGPEPAFVWKSYSRFVELYPVRTGWLVLWGRYEELGAKTWLNGSRIYPDFAGARRRIADAVMELTRRPALADEALILLSRAALPDHHPETIPPAL